MRSIFGSNYSSSKESTEYDKNPVEVYCRIRPLPTNQKGLSCVIIQSPTKLELTPFEDHKSKFKYKYSFTFKRIFPENTEQNDIFEETTVPLLRNLLRGENGLLFTYGVTCSGKTYTMFGEYNNPGLVPKCIYSLFKTINGNQTQRFLIKSDKMNGFEEQTIEEALEDQIKHNKRKLEVMKKVDFLNCDRKLDENIEGLTFTVFITYVEVYNNIIYDLLGDTPSVNHILREDCNKNIYVNNVQEIEVKCASEALSYYCMGSKRKKTAQTVLNNTSSRSHSIFTIRLIIQHKDQFKISQLSLVDLAGSERSNRTNSSGLRLKEASCINNSLMSLRQCLEILRENEQKGTRKIVPYRESRLTHLFKNYFEGRGKVKMIICVNPSIQDHEENFHVLKFAEITQEVRVRCELKLPVIPEIDVTSLHDEEEQNTIIVPTTPQDNHIKPLITYLKRRNAKLTKLREIQENSTKFRQHLFHLQNEKQMLQKQVQYYLPAEKQKLEMMKEKYREIELKLDQVVEKCEEKENTITQLNRCLEEKDVKLNEALMEKYKQRQKLDDITNRLKNELDIKLQHQKEYIQAQMKENTNKLELVKGILTEPSIVKSEQCESLREQSCSRTLIPRMKTAVSNIRYNKSCVKSAKWLEHKPGMPVPLPTVLQPKMKRKKSVASSICKKDIVNSKRNKYVLISQSKDGDGDLETEIFKGDIIPTCSGGAQIILNDVERLTHESPLQENSL